MTVTSVAVALPTLTEANASRKVHGGNTGSHQCRRQLATGCDIGGMPLPVAFASQHTDFVVTLRGTPRVDIRVAGSEA